MPAFALVCLVKSARRNCRAERDESRSGNSSPASRLAGETFAKSAELFPQIQLLDHGLVAVGGGALEIIEQLAAARDHLQQAAARRMIFGVVLRCSVSWLIRCVRRATCTSALPVSLSCMRSA